MQETMLILHFLGLAMGLGTSFGFMFLGIAGAKMEKADRLKFQLNAMGLSRMGHIGLTLLVISGTVLMAPYWSVLPSSPVLIAKLVLVLVLGALIGIITSIGKKAMLGNPEEQLTKIQPLGKIALLTGVAIVVLAVYFFR
ncbi:MAG TPA: hypothetical protein DIW47_10190 [Bacteroidetes bacterium]|nr:hypothetical protein [Bacteroidota bacterium]